MNTDLMNNRVFHLWGDSIAQGVIFSPDRRRYCLTPRRCARILQEDGVPLESHARMGATIGDGYADFESTATKPGDVAIIEFGGNDCDLDWQAVSDQPHLFHDGKTPLPEFAEMLRLFIRRIRARHMEPVVVLPPPLHSSRYFNWVCRGLNEEAVITYLGDVEHIGRWHDSYVAAIRDAAEQTGCRMLDLHTPFLKARNFPSLICEDGIHPNQLGQELMARVALTEMAAG